MRRAILSVPSDRPMKGVQSFPAPVVRGVFGVTSRELIRQSACCDLSWRVRRRHSYRPLGRADNRPGGRNGAAVAASGCGPSWPQAGWCLVEADEGRLLQETVMKAMKNLVSKLIKDEQGGEVLEYALIAGLIIVGAIAAVTAVGNKVLARWNSLQNSI